MSTNKSKGTSFETAIVNLLLEVGFETPRRIVMFGAKGDKGDIWLGEQPNNPDIIIEAKSRKIESPYKMVEDFINEAHIEYKNAKNINDVVTKRALVIVKRPNLGVKDAWLIWKNSNNITLRCRVGDVINDTIYNNCETEEERIDKLELLLS